MFKRFRPLSHGSSHVEAQICAAWNNQFHARIATMEKMEQISTGMVDKGSSILGMLPEHENWKAEHNALVDDLNRFISTNSTTIPQVCTSLTNFFAQKFPWLNCVNCEIAMA